MQNSKNKFKKLLVGLLIFPLVILFVTACFDITGVTQPSTAKVGETITITVDVNYDSEDTDQNYKFLIFGMMAPKSWDIANNAVVAFSSSVNQSPDRPGSGNMIADPQDLTFWGNKSKGSDGNETGNTWTQDMNAILDIGENYGEVEWVAFRSENPIDASQISVDGTITVTLTVGDGHTGAQLGYWIGSHNDGFKQEDSIDSSTQDAESRFWDTGYASINITGAASGSTDLTGPAPTFTAFISPEGYLFDDIITVRFDAKEGFNGANTALLNANAVHLNATIMLGDGTTITKADRDAASSMTLVGNNIWEITMWPPGYFDVTAGNLITEIHLSFSNADGSITVRNPGYDSDIVFGANCQ
jgi:hypothetical protein|tara:strand:+ start:1417 stop:2493 length:1077 start_codon:yes stop_codon:yes gene_type:complete